MTFVQEQGSVIVRDTPTRVQAIKELLARVDVPSPQVLFTCYVITGSDSESEGEGSLPKELVVGMRELVLPDPGIMDGEIELVPGAVEPRVGEIVEVELRDWPGRPAEGGFEAHATQARKATRLTLGPEGLVFGIRPGRYRLKATSIESEEWDDGEIEVVAGKTLTLSLTVRR